MQLSNIYADWYVIFIKTVLKNLPPRATLLIFVFFVFFLEIKSTSNLYVLFSYSSPVLAKALIIRSFLELEKTLPYLRQFI